METDGCWNPVFSRPFNDWELDLDEVVSFMSR